MEIKALWGFIGDKGQVRAGEKLTVAAEEGHTLIGKGLAAEVVEAKAEPKNTKQAAPKENK